MAVSEDTRMALDLRAEGRCECTMKTCGHIERCENRLDDDWEVHHLDPDGGDGLSNLKALCIPYHKNTPSYGSGKRT